MFHLSEPPTPDFNLITPSDYALAIIGERKLPKYILRVRSLKKGVLKVVSLNDRKEKVTGFIHITTTRRDYLRRRGNKKFSRAILIVPNQSEGDTFDHLLERFKELSQYRGGNDTRKKRPKKLKRNTHCITLDPEEE